MPADRSAVQAARRSKRRARPAGAHDVLMSRLEALELALREIPDELRPRSVEWEFDRVLRAAQKLGRSIHGLSPEEG